MADIRQAVEYSLGLEDATLSGRVTDIPGDAGGQTRYGIASHYHPELVATTYYTTMSNADALQVAILTLTKDYAAPLHLDKIDDQLVADVMLAFAINRYPAEAIRTMQDACNRVYPQSQGVVVDGILGAVTLAAINRVMPITLANAFRLLVIAHYAATAKDNVLRGLVRRALQ